MCVGRVGKEKIDYCMKVAMCEYEQIDKFKYDKDKHFVLGFECMFT